MDAIDIEACRQHFQQQEHETLRLRETHRRVAHTSVRAVIASIMPHYPEVKQVYLFGSVTAPGRFHANSDIDIAIEGTSAASYFSIWRDLEAIVQDWRIDLRELKDESYFAQRVRQQGELVYEYENSTS
ncbi:MAG: nucleotidyltransferase domain-containing protein [Thermosynechococcaceae cyanobacterium]